MEEPLTDELLEQLLAAPDPLKYASENNITERSLPDYLYQLLDKYKLERSTVIRNAGLNDTYGYQIFMGQRKPTRDKVLQLVFALGANLQEANRMLQAAGVNELYAKNRRDAIIIFSIDKSYSLQKVNEELYRFNENTVS